MSEGTYQGTDFAEIRNPFRIDGETFAFLIDVLVTLLKAAKFEGVRGGVSLREFVPGVVTLLKGPERRDELMVSTMRCLVDRVMYQVEGLSRKDAGSRERSLRVSGVSVVGRDFTVGVVAERLDRVRLEFYAFVRWEKNVSPERIRELFEALGLSDELLTQLIPSEDLRGWLLFEQSGGKKWLLKPRRNAEMPDHVEESVDAFATVS